MKLSSLDLSFPPRLARINKLLSLSIQIQVEQKVPSKVQARQKWPLTLKQTFDQLTNGRTKAVQNSSQWTSSALA
jgi:hypothetical protein